MGSAPPSAVDLFALARAEGTVLLDAQRARGVSRRARLFHSPAEVLTAWRSEDVKEVLRRAERLAASGMTLAGFLAYEAGAAFGLSVAAPDANLPLVWLGAYERAVEVREEDWRRLGDAPLPRLRNGAFNVSPLAYVQAVERVRELIAAGDTYQVNLTCKYLFDLAGQDPGAFGLYRHLRRAHPVAYGAYLNLGEIQVLSFSPELFLARKGEMLVARPMKGTIGRGLGSARDEALKRRLRASEKDRAENVMIVDLMRNDLGRVCETGSVRVPRLFECETLGSVHQMTSAVEGRVRAGVGFAEIFEAAFPSGSVTGAPKYRTMQIIRDLEGEPRGPYCGAIGRLGPGSDFSFNVAIRTLVHRAGRCRLGVGSGITWGSDPEREWAETVLKTRFLGAAAREFALFETLLLRSDGSYAHLREHLARLARSARYWGWRFPRARVLAALDETARRSARDASSESAKRHGRGADAAPQGVIVRLEIDREGQVNIKTRPVGNLHPPIRVTLSSVRIDESDPLVYHKTTFREPYDAALAEAKKHDCAEALLANREGRLTEGSFTNLFLQIDGCWFTPPVSDGLLPGIWRRDFMRRVKARERSLAPHDLRAAERIVAGNSVRGEIEVAEIVDENGECVWERPKEKRDG